jgi:predicted phage terminase large subunit-like protein
MSDLADALSGRYGRGPQPLIRAGLEAATLPIAMALPAPGRTKARETFVEWTQRIRPQFQWYRHNILVADVLQKVADGEINRVIIIEPPRHGKSEQMSRLFSAYYLDRYPERWVGLCSYGAELAETLSVDAQYNFERGGGELHPRHKGASHWKTVHGGGMWCAGMGGPIGGKGFHLGIIDDPIKNAEESLSELIGRRNQNWYKSTYYTRQEPGAAIVIATTRWPGPGDLIGWLYSEEGSDEDEPEKWHVIHFEALFEGLQQRKQRTEIPDTCTREPDWRTEEDQALCPERYPADKLKKIQKRIGPFWWSPLFQGWPVPLEGKAFKREWFDIVPISQVPSPRRPDVRYWDTASTEDGGDYTVGTRMREGVDGFYYVLHVVRGQWGPDHRKSVVRQVATMDGEKVEQWGQQEPGSSGVDARMDFQKLMHQDPPRPAYVEHVTGDKATRAMPFQAASAGGFVKLVEGEWNKAWLDEVVTLWEGAKHDDQGETAAGAFVKLALGRGRLLDTREWKRIIKGATSN